MGVGPRLGRRWILYSEVQCIMFNGHMGHAPLPVNRQIDTTENITFEQIGNLAGGNKTILCSVAFVYFLPPV